MIGKDFLKKEHWILKILYFAGIIMFLIHFNYFFKGENEGHSIYPIIAYSSMIVFFSRLIKFINKYNN